MATRTMRMTPQVRQILRKEITDFLNVLVNECPEKNWPAVPPAELVDALGDSLIQMGQGQTHGVAMLQTLIHDLQDKVNAHLNSKE